MLDKMRQVDLNLPLINVITPVLNSPDLLIQTMQSVVFQIGVNEKFQIRHIIVDGNSSDMTLLVVKEFIERNAQVGIDYVLISERDTGMYDALAKGLARIQPGIVCYQNAGDLYHQGAFSVVSDLCLHVESGWFYGRKVMFSENGTCFGDHVPLPYQKHLALNGFYGYRKHSLGFFQQESLFFTHDLLDSFDLEIFRRFKLAGDFYLFLHLIKKCQGIFVNALLSGHRIHLGQLSENISGYRAEMQPHIQSTSVINSILFLKEKILYKLPSTIRLLKHKKSYSRDLATGNWILTLGK